MAIKLNENGRIEYKTQWKEDDKATQYSVMKTYDIVKILIKTIRRFPAISRCGRADKCCTKYALRTMFRFCFPSLLPHRLQGKNFRLSFSMQKPQLRNHSKI